MKTLFLTVLALLAGVGAAGAQRAIDQSVPSAATGEVAIYNTAGSVRVTGWDRAEVRVTGTLGEDADRLSVTGGDRTEIRVIDGPRRGNRRGTVLEVRVPAGKTVRVQTTSADVRVTEVVGVVAARSTSGNLEVSGSPREVTAGSTSGDVTFAGGSSSRVRASSTSGNVVVRGTVRESVAVESVSGDVDVSAATPEVRAEAVSGNVTLRGVSGRVSAATVSGNTEISGSRVQYGAFETVSGNFVFAGDLQRGVGFNIQSHSGDVELRLPADVGADFEVSTFSGAILNDFGPDGRRPEGRGPGRELRFTAGGGGGTVAIRSFSGNVKLLRR